MADKRFKNVVLDHQKVSSVLTEAGAENLTSTVMTGGKIIHHAGVFNGQRFLVKLFINEKGKCTIGGSTGYDGATFGVIAELIKDRCSFGSTSPLNVNVPRFDGEHAQFVIDFLEGEGAHLERDEVTQDYRIVRVKGPHGDSLTIKHFNNGTFQMQGVHAQVAGWALDAVQTRLPLGQVLAHQKEVYAVPLSVDQIKQNLESRVPHAHDHLSETIRIQLSSSLAMTQVGISLEDHSAIAFNALRGLEGYCFQLLAEEVGVDITSRAKLGEFFDTNAPTLRILSTYKSTCSEPVHEALVDCYRLWQNQRNRLFHMDGNLDATRILRAREEAVAIVDQVLSSIDNGHQKIRLSKGAL